MGNKILIATLTKNTVTSQCAFSLVNLVNYSRELAVNYIIQMGADIIGARIMLVRKAIAEGYTHIFFVDEDVSFPKDTLLKLLAHDKDIVGADYNFRELPIRGMATPLTEKSDLYKCKAIPSGLMLIRLSVFEKIPEPWFLFDRNEKGDCIASEDVYFCRKAIDAGFEVWCDDTIKAKHNGNYAY